MSDADEPTVSPAVLARNRANGNKSTGPRAARGKARSRLNAITRGLRAEGPVDDAAVRDLERRAAALAEVLAPENAFEDALVARLATAFQRLERVEELERDAFDGTMSFRVQSDGAKLANNSRCRQTFNVLDRYRASAANARFNTVRPLEALRHARRAPQTPASGTPALPNEPKPGSGMA